MTALYCPSEAIPFIIAEKRQCEFELTKEKMFLKANMC